MLTEQVILDSLRESLESRTSKDIIKRKGRMELLNFARQLIGRSSQCESGQWALITMSQIVSDRAQYIPMSTLISLVDLFFNGAFQLSPETCDKQTAEAVFTAQLSIFYRVYPEIFPDMFSLTNPKSVLFLPPDRLCRFLDKVTDSFTSSPSAGENLVLMVQARMLEDGSQANIMTAVQRVFDAKNPEICETLAGLVQWMDLKVLCAMSFEVELMKWATNRETIMLALSIIQKLGSIRAEPFQVRKRLVVLNCFEILNDNRIYADEQMLVPVESVLITVINAHKGIDEFPELAWILLKFFEYDFLDTAFVNVLADVLGTRQGLDVDLFFQKAMTMTTIRYESLSEVPETGESFVRALRLVIVIASKSAENGQVVFRDEVLKWLLSLDWTPAREIALTLFREAYTELVANRTIDSGVWIARIVSILEEFIFGDSDDISLMSCLSCMSERHQTLLVRKFEGTIRAQEIGALLKFSVHKAIEPTLKIDEPLITGILEAAKNVDDLSVSIIDDVIKLVVYLTSRPSQCTEEIRALVHGFSERAITYLLQNKRENDSSELVILGSFLGWEDLARVWPFVTQVDELALKCMSKVSFGDEVTGVEQRREIFELFRQSLQCDPLLPVFLFEADKHRVFVEHSREMRQGAKLGMLKYGAVFLHDMPNLHLLQYFQTTCLWLESLNCAGHSPEFVKVLFDAMAERSLLSQRMRVKLFSASLPVLFAFFPAKETRAKGRDGPMKAETCSSFLEHPGEWGRYFEFLISQVDPLDEVSPGEADDIRQRVGNRMQTEPEIPVCCWSGDGEVWINVISMVVAGIRHGTAISKVDASLGRRLRKFCRSFEFLPSRKKNAAGKEEKTSEEKMSPISEEQISEQ